MTLKKKSNDSAMKSIMKENGFGTVVKYFHNITKDPSLETFDATGQLTVLSNLGDAESEFIEEQWDKFNKNKFVNNALKEYLDYTNHFSELFIKSYTGDYGNIQNNVDKRETTGKKDNFNESLQSGIESLDLFR